MMGQDWRPYSPATFLCPAFPSYVSGHSTVSGACSEALRLVITSYSIHYTKLYDGRTAIKVTLGKYLEGLGTTGFGPAQVTDAPNPILRLLNQTQRTWNAHR